MRRPQRRTVHNQSFPKLSTMNEPLQAHAPYHALSVQLGLNGNLIYDPKWAAAPDFMQLIVDHALSAKPATIVECSSGLTTLMLARCCELKGWGEVLSLENGADYADQTRAELERHGLTHRATVLDAPLVKYALDDLEFQWYSNLAALTVKNIDMLVIDGPPGFIQPHSRYPALPLLFNLLADGCQVFMDDAGRPDEREIVKMWQARYPTIEHEYIGTERGSSMIRVRKI